MTIAWMASAKKEEAQRKRPQQLIDSCARNVRIKFMWELGGHDWVVTDVISHLLRNLEENGEHSGPPPLFAHASYHSYCRRP